MHGPDFAWPMNGKGRERRGIYLGLAKRFLLGDGIMVPVDEAEDAEEEESSSCTESGDGLRSSSNSSSCPISSSSSSSSS